MIITNFNIMLTDVTIECLCGVTHVVSSHIGAWAEAPDVDGDGKVVWSATLECGEEVSIVGVLKVVGGHAVIPLDGTDVEVKP